MYMDSLYGELTDPGAHCKLFVNLVKLQHVNMLLAEVVFICILHLLRLLAEQFVEACLNLAG